MAGNTGQLLEAVNALYNHPDEKVKKQANHWLEQWQQSLEAWSISDAILHDQNSPFDAQYFCAQTLRTKVQRDFEELPEGAIGSLRDSIMELMLRYAAKGPMVRVQLCLAFAALVAHVPATQWGAPASGVVQWLTNQLEGQPPAVSIPVMLEMLVVLPEEATNYSPSVKPERRRQLHEEMVNNGPMALQVLASCLSQPDVQTRARVLEAFAAWLVLTPGAGLPGHQLAQHPLTTAALEGLNAQETFDEAVEALVELIYSTSNRGAPDQDSMALVVRLVPAVIGLIPRFALSARVARAEAAGQPTDAIPGADTADDEDTMKGMARLFAEIGEAFTVMIASGRPDAMKPVEALLEVAGHPDNDMCAMSFNFWHRLSRQLNSGFTSSSGQQGPGDAEQRKAPFYPAFTQLVTLIRGRVRYPDDWVTLHDEAKRDFKHSRYSISDTLLDAASVLGDQRILQILVEPLQSLGQQGNAFDWATAEAALQCIKSVNKVVTSAEQPMLVALFRGLPQLPAVPRLQYTAALTLGAYSEWIAMALDQGPLQELMPQLLHMLTSALGHAESASAAAMAFRDLCKACGARLGPHLEALTHLYQSVQSTGAMAAAAASATVDEDDVQQIMEAVALLVSALPEEQRRAALTAMLQPVVTNLQQALQQRGHALGQGQQPGGGLPPPPPLTPDAKILPLFDRLTVILRHVNDAGAVTEACIQVWPLVEAGLQLYIQNGEAVEKICRTPRYALRTAGKLAATGSLVSTIMAALPGWFQAAPHSCFLYLASELVKIFGDVPRQEGALAELLGKLLERACQGLQRLRQFNEDPDIADDTFLLAARVLSYSPKLLLNNPTLLAALLDSAQAGLLVQHRDAGESVLVFLSRLFEQATLERCSKEAVQQLLAILAPKGPGLYRLLLGAAAGAVPPSRLTYISTTIVNILKVTKEQGGQWFSQAAQLLPPEATSQGDKARLLQTAAQVAGRDESKSSLGEMEDALVELSELVRRNRRSEEAAQNALLPPELKQSLW